jgi:hypothetical protein
VQLVHRSTKVLAEARGRVEERFGFGGDPVVLGDRVHHGTQRSTEAFSANYGDRAADCNTVTTEYDEYGNKAFRAHSHCRHPAGGVQGYAAGFRRIPAVPLDLWKRLRWRLVAAPLPTGRPRVQPRLGVLRWELTALPPDSSGTSPGSRERNAARAGGVLGVAAE